MILYLRTDFCIDTLLVGGSIGHTLGVINNFSKRHKVLIFSSVAQQMLGGNKKKM